MSEVAPEELSRMRRFALVSGVLLITYVAAGAAPSQETEISPFGFPFTLNRPELVPIGFVAMATWSMVRFIVYGCFKTRSPGKKKRDLWNEFHIQWSWKNRWFEAIGPENLSRDGQEVSQKLTELFPSVGKLKATARPASVSTVYQSTERVGNKDPEEVTEEDRLHVKMEPLALRKQRMDRNFRKGFLAVLEIPLLVRLISRLEDFDYWSPIWVNLFALGLFATSWFRDLEFLGT